MPKRLAKTWTEPKISPRNTTELNAGPHCFVWFRYYNHDSNQWILKALRPALPHKPTKKDYYLECKALIRAIEFKLEKQTWNPINGSYKMPEENIIYFPHALDFAYSKKKDDWCKKSSQDYSSAIKYLKVAASGVNLNFKNIADFKLSDFRMILDEVQRIRNLSNEGYNKYREYLSALITELIQWEIVEINVIHHVKSKPVYKKLSHRPPTLDERTAIVNLISTQHRNYFRFICILYGCGLRPAEICKLKIKHLHKSDQVFRLRAEDAKDREEREVTIPDWVMEILSELNLHTMDPDWYLFSTNNRHATFLPGPNQMHRNTPTTHWRKIVKENLKLDVNQYSLKKLSGNDMIKLQTKFGIDKLLEMPRVQFGHSSQKQTEVYVTEHLEVIKEMVKSSMPVL